MTKRTSRVVIFGDDKSLVIRPKKYESAMYPTAPVDEGFVGTYQFYCESGLSSGVASAQTRDEVISMVEAHVGKRAVVDIEATDDRVGP